MLMGIVETSLFFATGFIMEGAAGDAARLIRTGQVQSAADPVKAFETALCQKMSILTNCLNLKYEVIPIPENSFINAQDLKPQFDEDGILISQGFDPGGASDAASAGVMASDAATPASATWSVQRAPSQ